MVRTWLATSMTLLALAGSSCTPAAPEIRVLRRDHALVVDVPWTFWRWIGLKDRTLCIHSIEVFDARRVVWKLTASGDDMAPCVDVKAPIKLGVPLEGFAMPASLHLKTGVTYGVDLYDVNRVDFVPFSDRSPRNITDYSKFFEAPCDSRLSKYSKRCQ